jgi:hypothetical protein
LKGTNMSLAEQSLGLDPGSTGPVTLQEKRQAYDDWLKSGRWIDRPNPALHTRTDEGPGDPILAARRNQTHVDAAGKLLHDLPAGYICRIDEGEGTTADVSEEVRLKLAGALVAKMDTADAETATRMANAGNALLAPLKVRADDAAADKAAADKKAADDKAADDANVKNRVLNDKAADAGKEFTLADVMTALGGFTKRLDAIEGKGRDSEHTVTEPEDKKKKAADDDLIAVRTRLMRGDNRIRVDSMFREDANATYHEGMNEINRLAHGPETQDFFAAVQSRADDVYLKLGKQAQRPMDGEQLGAYRRRLLVPLQGFCPTFKHSDLRVAVVDNAGFEPMERAIYQAAADEAINPKSVPLGTLREIIETRGGHTYSKFYGNPKSWMAAYMPNGRLVQQITVRQDGSEKIRYQARKGA